MAFLLQVRMFRKTTAAVFFCGPPRRASSSVPASFRCSFADAKKMLHPRNAETGEVCPQTYLSSVEKVITFSSLNEQSHRKATSWLP
ncbi:hypothetical protein [Azospirillum brasilense]|uniref:hypothetical protein n=1 Tax=Azospirillum brasilense TaxID=192 RepID=UPI0011EBD577|nr:hypothetical protein [Azospirillum brasilense]